jgi:hypothetical protein
MAVQLKKQTRPSEYDVAEDDRVYMTRSPSSVRKYRQPLQQDTLDDPSSPQGPFIQRRRASSGLGATNGVASKAVRPFAMEERRIPRRLPLLAIFLGMAVAAILAVGLSSFGAWWQMRQDDAQYGRPRTFQFDAVVGHGDSTASPTHFIIINLDRHVQIIEFPGGDGTHARMYLGPTLFGDGQDLTPVTAEIRDVNGDGKPDLILHIQDQRIVFINDGTMFRPLKPGEHVKI